MAYNRSTARCRTLTSRSVWTHALFLHAFLSSYPTGLPFPKHIKTPDFCLTFPATLTWVHMMWRTNSWLRYRNQTAFPSLMSPQSMRKTWGWLFLDWVIRGSVSNGILNTDKLSKYYTWRAVNNSPASKYNFKTRWHSKQCIPRSHHIEIDTVSLPASIRYVCKWSRRTLINPKLLMFLANKDTSR